MANWADFAEIIDELERALASNLPDERDVERLFMNYCSEAIRGRFDQVDSDLKALCEEKLLPIVWQVPLMIRS